MAFSFEAAVLSHPAFHHIVSAQLSQSPVLVQAAPGEAVPNMAMQPLLEA
ncbi:hypothetical protein [Sphingomonas sp. GC_Shp_3]|nr:hypothetical protein [Sphingomonas sp. GC_Shp_3]